MLGKLKHQGAWHICEKSFVTIKIVSHAAEDMQKSSGNMQYTDCRMIDEMKLNWAQTCEHFLRFDNTGALLASASPKNRIFW